MAMVIARDPSLSGDEVFARLLQIRPRTWPNSRMVHHAEDLMGFRDRLGWRLLFIERPELLAEEDREIATRTMALRLLGLTGPGQPWLSVADALLALDHGVPAVGRWGDDGSYRARLAAWLMNSAAVLDDAMSPRRHDHRSSSVDSEDHDGR
jgi:hypothetical protein